ncbi:hypothetical protein B0H13DRAFT_1914782 [Mycena leptocephala]|nr:hypothetical protein B0H13DRAFT_1914782 [Mycena leptocephala]
MSVFFDGIPALEVSVSYDSAPTVLSSAFYQKLVGANASRLLVTTVITGYPSCSSVIACQVSSAIHFDVVLGLDWSACFRDSLIALGYRIPSNFDPWHILSGTDKAVRNGLAGHLTAPLPLLGSRPSGISHDPSSGSVQLAQSNGSIRAGQSSTNNVHDHSRLRFQLELGKKREKLLLAHSSAHSVRAVFDRIESLPKGSLVVLAQSHGIQLGKSPTCEYLRAAIVNHVGTGGCTSREGYSSYLGCSSIESQLASVTATPGTAEDPATLLQIHLIRQIAPILQLRPLRRLLNLHDVSYVETDNVKKLRNRLKRFLDRLVRGKFGDDELSLTGSARKARAREHARLRNEWPQVIPDHLKRKLLANFNLEISSTALATFVCGSCVENCPIDDKVALPFEDFDMNLLKRPDEFIDISAEDSEMSGEKTDEIVPDDLHPWLDSRCPDPPMPMPDNRQNAG